MSITSSDIQKKSCWGLFVPVLSGYSPVIRDHKWSSVATAEWRSRPNELFLQNEWRLCDQWRVNEMTLTIEAVAVIEAVSVSFLFLLLVLSLHHVSVFKPLQFLSLTLTGYRIGVQLVFMLTLKSVISLWHSETITLVLLRSALCVAFGHWESLGEAGRSGLLMLANSSMLLDSWCLHAWWSHSVVVCDITTRAELFGHISSATN